MEPHSVSERMHFWLRVAALAAILAAEFGPKLWSSAQSAPTRGGPRETAVAVEHLAHDPAVRR
ncbi:MAG TPA: hypothetical protein VEK07_00145 [Polyangiaceae bacterium]|nr:hypothetical protein [Polyangiaceae bacterium]